MLESMETVPFQRAEADLPGDATDPERPLPPPPPRRSRPSVRLVPREPEPPVSPGREAATSTDKIARKWAPYVKMGLGPRALTKAAATWMVSGYRLLGFAILSIIVFVLVGYIATSAFYFFSRSWLTPTVVSLSDDKVVAVKSQLAALQNQRDKIAAELHDSERTIAVEQRFQADLLEAVRADLEGRKAALRRVSALASSASSTREHIRSTNDDFARRFADKTHAEFAAGLIDRTALLSGDYQLAQISSSNLSLAERQAELENQAQKLSSDARSLGVLLGATADDPLSYDVLKIKRDFEASKLALAKAVESRGALVASLARQDETMRGLTQSAYLRALDDHAAVALVPYGNLESVKAETPLYSCRVGIVLCHEVGSVLVVLPGEVQLKHPHNDSVVRGQLAELRLTDPRAAEDEVLFAGGRPLWL
jgi:hypothetical protein